MASITLFSWWLKAVCMSSSEPLFVHLIYIHDKMFQDINLDHTIFHVLKTASSSTSNVVMMDAKIQTPNQVCITWAPAPSSQWNRHLFQAGLIKFPSQESETKSVFKLEFSNTASWLCNLQLWKLAIHTYLMTQQSTPRYKTREIIAYVLKRQM